MKSVLHKAGDRGYAKHGWLESHHSFSFASYYNPAMMGFGALRVINDDVIAGGTGFGQHPHQNMEIITIPLSGALEHQDSIGNSAVIHTGEVQVMSAGTGVEHSEVNASQTEVVSLLQIWILTKRDGIAPRYDQKAFDTASFNNTFAQVVGSEDHHKENALYIHQDAFLTLGRFDVDTEKVYALQNKDNGVYIFVIEGEAVIADQIVGRRDALGIWDTDHINVKVKTGSFVLIVEVPMAY